MSFFPCCELRCRLISGSRLTAHGSDKSYHSLLNVFTQKSSGHGVGKDYSCAKQGLTTLFHLSVGSVSLLMPADLRQYCCHQNEQSWIRLLIWLKNNLERKNKVFSYFLWFVVLITSDMGEVMGVGHQDGEWSGSASFGSNFLLHLLKPTENLSWEPSLLFS